MAAPTAAMFAADPARVAVYGENLLDNQYVSGLGTYGKTVLGTVGARLTPPRVWGVEFTAGF